MEEGKVRAWYDKAVDIFYMLFKEGSSYEVVEADPDVHLELDEKGKVMGIEILNAGKSGLIKQVARAIAESTS
nr:DUF2283 domain-containing protein [Candidatus Njordarchaeota archaeon]